MDKLKFEFIIKSFEDQKTNVLAVTSITTKEGKIYLVPQELQPIKHHETLMETEAYKILKKTLQKRHEKRCIWITLSDELKKTYMDGDDNIQFKKYFLEEVISTTGITQPIINEGISEESLSRILEKITNMNPQLQKQTNLKKISEKFVIEKFTGENSNVTQWMKTFEKECDRFEIVEDEKKIEIFRLFLDKSCLNWYSSMLIRLTLTSEWKQWKEDFCDTYESKGWTPIRYAIDFKYKTGSLLDYAIRKEKILLEMDSTINKSTLIDLIAVGLPSFITDRVDRKKIKETKDLFNEVKSLEHLVNKKGFDKKKITNSIVKTKELKEPCKICRKLNKGNRYHSEDSCWFKTNEGIKEKQNVINFVNNSEVETELNNMDQKN